MKPCRTLTIAINLLAMLSMPIGVPALDLATLPLASTTTNVAKPNILFILDDSFSMTYTYMPEWAGKAAICGNPAHVCTMADNAFRSSDFNTLYYNPKFRYLPARNANGTPKDSMNSTKTSAWTAVPNDAYGVIRNDDSSKTATTSNLISGTLAAAYTVMVPGEYCTQPNLRVCQIQAAASTTHPYPAYVRFCNSASRATSATSPPANSCQATVAQGFSTANTRYPTRGSVPGALNVVNIIPTDNSYTKAPQRSDCAGDHCTYAEEMTNYANWWAYYRTRLQTMKTSTSLAFANIDDKYRVGYSVINNHLLEPDRESYSGSGANKFLHVAPFDATQKKDFYDRLFKARPALNLTWQGHTYTDPYHYTPLRAALSHAGRYFAKKHIDQTADPMQYACQANFSILSTDGSWNKESDFTATQLDGDHVESGSFRALRLDGSTLIGNQDNDANLRPPKKEGTTFVESLADVAMYYAETDIRTGCSEENGGVCGSTANQLKQNMTTFTVGLGINGTFIYQDDYKTATSGDFYDIKQGIKTWPDNCHSDYCAERVDDLWHAAVNGNGTYFSAQDPQQLQESLTSALTEIYALANAGSAAATSTLSPVVGNNSAYVASYTSMKWTGNLESRDIDTGQGVTSKTARWCAEDVKQGDCAPPNQVFTHTANNSARTYCAPAGTTEFTAAMEISGPCTGTLKAKFSASDSDSRAIYTHIDGTLRDFSYDNLNATQRGYFSGTSLSQWNALDTDQQQNIAEKLIGFIRGHSAYEDRGSNLANKRLFRYREASLGDITDSTAVYVGTPNFNYLESSYTAFKTAQAQANRKKSVYVGANDGMLHAFTAIDSTDIASEGTERWAYIPSMVLPNLWKLADKNYAYNHQNYVNGPTTVADICNNSCSAASDWKTALVGGLGQGGKGFYALDITSDTPQLLWEFDSSDDADLGYSFGNPVITKQRDGTWVVLLTSGYNNSGVGYLYVLNANTGALLRKISTRVGTAGTPSGLAKISAFVAKPSENNQADYAYAGDLLGNLWRFKIDSAGNTASDNTANPLLLARLTNPSGIAQAITARPELGKINGNRVVFIGTGKYLESADLTNVAAQTLYAIKDVDIGGLTRANLSSRTMVTTGDTRSAAKGANAWITDYGWYIDLPNGERQVTASKLASGTLIVPTMVPSSAACSPGGYGWINYINANNGGAVLPSETGTVLFGTKTNAIPVGINLVYIAGTPKVSFTGASNATPQLDPNARFNSGRGFLGKRASWRELIR